MCSSDLSLPLVWRRVLSSIRKTIDIQNAIDDTLADVTTRIVGQEEVLQGTLTAGELSAFGQLIAGGMRATDAAKRTIETAQSVGNRFTAIRSEFDTAAAPTLSQIDSVRTLLAQVKSTTTAAAMAAALPTIAPAIDTLRAFLGASLTASASETVASVDLERLGLAGDLAFTNPLAGITAAKDLLDAIPAASAFTLAATYRARTNPTFDQAVDLFDNAGFKQAITAYERADAVARTLPTYRSAGFDRLREVRRGMVKFDIFLDNARESFDFLSFKRSYLANLDDLERLTSQVDRAALESQYTSQLASLVADRAKLDDVIRRNDEAVAFFAARKQAADNAFTTIDNQLKNSPRFIRTTGFLWFTRTIQLDYTTDPGYLRARAERDTAAADYTRALSLRTSAADARSALVSEITTLNTRLTAISRDLEKDRARVATLQTTLDRQYRLLGELSDITLDVLTRTPGRAAQTVEEFNGTSSLIAELRRYQEAFTITSGTGVTSASTVFTPDGSSVVQTVATQDAFQVVSVTGASVGGIHAEAGTFEVYNLELGDGDNEVRITGTPAGTVNVTAGDGRNTFLVGDASRTTSQLAGALNIAAGTGSNRLAIDAGGTATAMSVVQSSVVRDGLTFMQLTGIAPVTVNYRSTNGFSRGVELATGTAADTVRIDAVHAGTTTSLATGAGGDTVTVTAISAPLAIATGDGADTVNIRSMNVGATVNTGDDNDTINVGSLAPSTGGTVDAIAARLTLDGGTGADTLNVDDTGDTAANSGTLSASELTGLGMTSGIGYSNAETLNVNLGSGDDTFTVASTNAATTTTLTTNAGADTVTIESTAGTTTVNTNDGTDTVNVRAIGGATTVNTGAADDMINVGSLAPSTGGTVNAIVARLTLDSGTGSDTLNVDDTGDTAANSGTLSATELTGLGMAAGIGYANTEAVNINLGSGGDTFTIASTNAATTTTLTTNAGADSVTIDSTAGTTTVNTNVGADTVLVKGTGATTTINTGDDADTVNVRAIGAATIVNTGVAADTVNVGSTAPGTSGTVDAIAARLTLDTGTGSDTLNVDDTADTAANIGTLSAAELTGLGMTSGIGYSNAETLNVNLGSGDDTFTIASTAANTTTTLTTNAGADSVTIESTAGTTTVSTGVGADTVNVRAISGAMTVNTGDDTDTINVGSLAPNAGGTVNAIAARLTLDAGTGTDKIGRAHV